MDLGKIIKGLFTAGIVILIGALVFPGIRSFLSGVDIAGWTPLDAASMKFLPYAAVIVGGYIALRALNSWRSG